jgi:hypothetical protein
MDIKNLIKTDTKKLLVLLTEEELNNVLKLLEEANECRLLDEVESTAYSIYKKKPGFVDPYDAFYYAYLEWIK